MILHSRLPSRRPVKFVGRFARATLAIDGRQVPVQVKWFVRRAAGDADGIISPALLPFESVTLAYYDPVAPSRHLSFVTSLEDEAGLHVRVPVESHSVKVRFPCEARRWRLPLRP